MENPVSNKWNLSWRMAWEPHPRDSPRAFLDLETGSLIWPDEDPHHQDQLEANPERYEEVPGVSREDLQRVRARASRGEEERREAAERYLRQTAAEWLHERGFAPSWELDPVEKDYGSWEDHWDGPHELVEAYQEAFPEAGGPHLMMCSYQDVHEAVMSGEDIDYPEIPPGVVV